MQFAVGCRAFSSTALKSEDSVILWHCTVTVCIFRDVN